MTILISAVIAAVSAQTALAGQRASRPLTAVNGRAGAGTASAPVGGGRTFIGGARPAASGGAPGFLAPRGGGIFRGGRRKVESDPTPAGTEEAPPNFTKPGALIRTTGQLPKYEKAEGARVHATDAGEIALEERAALDVGRAPGVRQGPKEALPSNSGAALSGGAAANSADFNPAY